jgi:hypothetical protein
MRARIVAVRSSSTAYVPQCTMTCSIESRTSATIENSQMGLDLAVADLARVS